MKILLSLLLLLSGSVCLNAMETRLQKRNRAGAAKKLEIERENKENKRLNSILLECKYQTNYMGFYSSQPSRVGISPLPKHEVLLACIQKLAKEEQILQKTSPLGNEWKAFLNELNNRLRESEQVEFRKLAGDLNIVYTQEDIREAKNFANQVWESINAREVPTRNDIEMLESIDKGCRAMAAKLTLQKSPLLDEGKKVAQASDEQLKKFKIRHMNDLSYQADYVQELLQK